MTPKFRALFSFEKKEIALFFTKASFLTQVKGLKLLIEREKSPDQKSVSHAKILIVTSRKVGKACIRNRLRRQIKSIVYESKLAATYKFRFALICYPQAAELSFAELKSFLVSTLQKITPSQ